MSGSGNQQRRVVGVVQARMGSSRLPGKALTNLVGQPVIWHVMKRLARAQRLDQVLLATTTAPGDDALADYVSDLGIAVVRGSEANVLARFIQAAELSRADVIVRVTGDCPLVDPWLVDYLVDALPDDAGYVRVEPDGVLIDEGVDPCATWALHRLAARAGDDPVAREHVTSYFKLHPDFVPVARCHAPSERRLEGARISVDTPADLSFLEKIYGRIGAEAGDLDVVNLVDLLRAEPGLMAINKHVGRKHARVVDQCVVIRCDGDSEIGLGHVVRCLAIAEALRDRHGLKVMFATKSVGPGLDLINARKFSSFAPPTASEKCEESWLSNALLAANARAVVIDVRTDLDPGALSRWREAGMLVATIDDGGPRRLVADLAFFPPVPQLRDMAWDGFRGTLHTGWQYLPLRRDFAHTTRASESGANAKAKVLVAMGGADPAGATIVAIDALRDVAAEVTIVLGGANPAADEVVATAEAQLQDGRVLRSVDDMATLLADNDLAVIAFGMTAYEAAAVGTPTLALNLTDDHAQSALALEAAGALRSAGLVAEQTAGTLGSAVREMLADRDGLRQMRRAAQRLIDGRGADRIADRIADRLTRCATQTVVAA